MGQRMASVREGTGLALPQPPLQQAQAPAGGWPTWPSQQAPGGPSNAGWVRGEQRLEGVFRLGLEGNSQAHKELRSEFPHAREVGFKQGQD